MFLWSHLRHFFSMGLPDLTEVRAERDVLQARMSEQALRISSLSARLERQRNDADVLAHAAASQLQVQLHDAHAEVQRLKEEVESKDKQLARLRQGSDERDKCAEKHALYGNLGNSYDKVSVLEKELGLAQFRVSQLEDVVRGLELDKARLEAGLAELRQGLADKDKQLDEIMALKLGEENQKSEILDTKASARTLSDIVSISEYDEDLQMRRAELKNQSNSFTHARDKDMHLNTTLPPEGQPNMSSLHVNLVDHFDFQDMTPHADSLPVYLTSTQNKDAYKSNINEMTAIASAEKTDSLKVSHSIPDNCSMYPNRNMSGDSKNISVEPKKINFSLEPSDNKTHEEHEFPSLQELGISLDVRQENFPDILTQLKHEIKKAKSELKNAEEQLCEFPALKKEVEELKNLLNNTVATMENDKKFYENQLESFSLNKKLLEQRLAELTREAEEKSKDLHLLKEDILRRENMILELAKEKRSLTSRISDLETKIEDLQSKNVTLDKFEMENKQMKEKINELQKLELTVSEKNQQIDSLNQHLDTLDDLQRRFNDKKEELASVKEALKQKTSELFQLQDSINALNRDIANVIEENDQLSDENKELKVKLSKIEKEQENATIKLRNSDSEVERLNSLNNELASRLDELKQLNENLKDKETEIEILHEDIDLYHNEITLLKEQLKMISRSPSPRTKVVEDKRTPDRKAANDKKQLVKIKKQISLLQHELDFNKKDLNDKAFELAKAKLNLTEMKANLSQATKTICDKEAVSSDLQQQTENLQAEINKLKTEKQQLNEQLGVVVARLREEANVAELKEKLREKAEMCQELEVQLANTRELVDRQRNVEERALCARSPTAELERAVRDQLDYSHALDRDMMEHILSASSDEREDVPRLALNTSRSSSVQSSSSERLQRLRGDNERLQLQLHNLECRLGDKDALIAELNRVRDQLSSDLQCAALRYEAERDNSARLMLLLDSQKDSSEALRQQDASVITLLQRRLESAMRSEAEQLRVRPRRSGPDGDGVLLAGLESEQLRSSISVLQAKLELERRRGGELQAQLDAARAQGQRDKNAADSVLAGLRAELVELRRLKRESCVELARCRELLRARAAHTRIEADELMKTPSRRTEIESPEVTLLKAGQRPTNEEKEQAIRYLQGRCLLLESYRKALVWQKSYLQRTLAGYKQLEARLALATPQETPRGIRRFKTAAWSVVAALRLRYVAARRLRVRAHSSHALLRPQEPCSSPLTPLGRELSSRSRLDLLRVSSPLAGDASRSPLDSPRREPFLFKQARSEAGRSALGVSRCLSRTADVP